MATNLIRDVYDYLEYFDEYKTRAYIALTSDNFLELSEERAALYASAIRTLTADSTDLHKVNVVEALEKLSIDGEDTLIRKSRGEDFSLSVTIPNDVELVGFIQAYEMTLGEPISGVVNINNSAGLREFNIPIEDLDLPANEVERIQIVRVEDAPSNTLLKEFYMVVLPNIDYDELDYTGRFANLSVDITADRIVELKNFDTVLSQKQFPPAEFDVLLDTQFEVQYDVPQHQVIEDEDGNVQFVGDFYAYLTAKLNETIQNVDSSITSLTTQISVASGSIESLVSAQTQLENDQITLETSVTQTASSITSLASRVTETEAGITSNASAITQLSDGISAEVASIQALQDLILSNEARLDINDGLIATNVTSIAAANGNISTLTTSVNQNATSITSVVNAQNLINGRLDTAESSITQLIDDIQLKVESGDVRTSLNVNLDGITMDADVVRSDTYSPDTSGWGIHADDHPTRPGLAEFNNLKARGQFVTTTVGTIDDEDTTFTTTVGSGILSLSNVQVANTDIRDDLNMDAGGLSGIRNAGDAYFQLNYERVYVYNDITGVTAYLGTLGLLSEHASVRFPNLPTTDPNVVGQIWNDTGTLKVSAG